MLALSIPHGTANRQRGVENALAHIGRQVRGRRQFHDLLVPALDGAIALEEMDQPAVPIADQLHFDVLGAAGRTSR